VTQDEVEQAVRTILHWIGENPDREGLSETPARVARAYKSYFSGYEQNPEEYLRKTFEETAGYDEMVLLRNIPFQSHCEHHLAPIVGHAWVGYVPQTRVVGISKLARVVEAFANRLQIQERLTAEIANVIERVLQPQGVAVVLKASHHCISARGVKKHGVDLTTSRMLGCFRTDPMSRQEFLAMVNSDIRD
jgi:GTP cyclohydrolase I